jgi:hypothetical protein
MPGVTNEPSVLWRLADLDHMEKGNGQSQTMTVSKKKAVSSGSRPNYPTWDLHTGFFLLLISMAFCLK